MKGAIKARLNHASPEKRTPFKHFVLFLTPQGVFAAPRLSARLKARLTNAFENFDPILQIDLVNFTNHALGDCFKP